MAFPFVFPGAYSVPQTLSNYAFGWIHSPNPEVNVGTPTAPVGVIYEGNANGTTLDYLKHINHNPLDTGDNLSTPRESDGLSANLVGLPDLAGDALALLGRPDGAGERRPAAAQRPGQPAGQRRPEPTARSSCPR